MSTLGSPARPAQPHITRTGRPWLDTSLAPVAAQLVGTLRDYSPDDVHTVLDQVTTADRDQLILVLAAMVDPDATPTELLAWTHTGPVPSRADLPPAAGHATCDGCGRRLLAKHLPRHQAACAGPPEHPAPVRLYLIEGTRHWRARCGYPECGTEFRADHAKTHYRVHHTQPAPPAEQPPPAAPRIVDPIAVEEAIAGRRTVPLSGPEFDAAVAELTAQGMSGRQIASRLRADERRVFRARARLERDRLIAAGVDPGTAATLTSDHQAA